MPSFGVSVHNDKDIIEWLAKQTNASEAIRQAIRVAMKSERPSDGEIMVALLRVESEVRALKLKLGTSAIVVTGEEVEPVIAPQTVENILKLGA